MTTPTDPLYASQWHFGLIGNIERIWDEYSGAGVHVGVYDDGIDLTHEDLAANYDASRHVVDGLGNAIIPVHDAGGAHGTATAGLVGAASNGTGGVGVAWGVSLTAVNIFNPSLYGYVNAADTTGFFDVVEQAVSRFDITSNSWGATPLFVNGLGAAGFALSLDGEYQYLEFSGRGGLGTIIVQAAGNDDMDANGDGVNASRYTITVAATESDGFAADYSNYGASILVTAPAAAVTTDRTGADGYEAGNYTTGFNGTSAATPVVSGVIALMLQANSGLGWRDVQDILAMSATLTGSAFNAASGTVTEEGLWQSNHSGIWNGGGNHIHTNYGYGMINAYNAVRMAEVWNLFSAAETMYNETIVTAVNDFADVALPDANATGLNFNIVVGDNLSIDHVSLTLDLSTTYIGDLNITLTSAAGTVITLARGNTSLNTDVNGNWVWGVDQLHGELSAGTWTVHVADLAGGDIATLRSATLNVYGSAANANDTYHFTDEFLTMAGFEAGRTVITDSDGGTDWMDLAAVQGDVSISMNSGSAFSVDGVTWAAMVGDYENIVTGDGNDTINGNDLDNIIYGMRGDDVISGGGNVSDGGAGDTMYGGAGNDTIGGGFNKDDAYGGAGNDTFAQESGYFADNVYGGTGIDTLDLSAETFETFMVNLTTQNYQYLPNSYGTNGTFDLVGVENVIGSSQNDSITGDTGANLLSGGGGDDTLKGGGGIDTLVGGAGNDYLFVDSANDIIDEVKGGGSDRVLSTVSFVLATDDNIEVLATTSSAGVGLINLSGNGLAQAIYGNNGANYLRGLGGADSLYGNAGADTLDGGTGIDRMSGGADGDTYFVDNAGDIIDEIAGGGSDRVLTTVSFALVADDNIELMATISSAGLAAINLTGNALRQSIYGNAGANRINGGAGSDTLVGNLGADSFVFDTALGASNVDKITDYTVADDIFVLENAIFTGIPLVGLLPLLAFEANLTGVSTLGTSRIVYETDTGKLFYDVDGFGGTAGVQFALITANLLGMDGNEFQII